MKQHILLLILAIPLLSSAAESVPDVDFAAYTMYEGRWARNQTNLTQSVPVLPRGLRTSGLLQAIILDSSLLIMNLCEGEHANDILQLVVGIPADSVYMKHIYMCV